MFGINDRYSKSGRPVQYRQNEDLTQLQFSRAFDRGAVAAGIVASTVEPGPQALIDAVPDDTSSTVTLTVGAAPVISAIDTIADQDFYRIELVAGHQYQIGMYGYTPAGPTDPVGPNGLPLLDSYLELYDSAGNLITAADGGADTVFNGANSGFDAVLIFTATTSGIYYVNARAFDNIPVDGDNGDMVGDYGLYAEDVTGNESLYTPYYTPDSPLYAIDWGTQVNKIHQTYRNPDGNEGTRDTGNAPSPVDPGAALGFPGKNVITIYFARAGDIFVSNDLTNPGLPPATITATGVQAFEHDAVMTALGEFSKVADIVYVEVNDRAQADFIYTSYIGTPGPGVSLLGSMSPPDESDEGLAQFNSGDERWNATNLAQGGFSFVTLIHEFGHGHGLAHPHDNGGHSGIMNGVEEEGVVADYTLGDFDLNQSVFTMMSYEDGWQSSPYGNADTDVGYGYLGGLMAFDIAAIQDKYGVNENYNTGNNTYVMKDVNAAGTYFYSIWDADGIDAITYSGARDANIDLRPATLRYEQGGGGWVSYAYGIYGGFTIANGVTIENATSGTGNDRLIGNAAANILDAGAGNDVLDGGAGDDTLKGGAGRDTLSGGAGADLMEGGADDDTYFADNLGDRITEAANQGYDVVAAGFSYTLNAGTHVELMTTGWIEGTAVINLTGNELYQQIWGNAAANTLSGAGGDDELFGFGGADTLLGGDGNDALFGGAGAADTLTGGLGTDTYFIDDAGDVIVELAGEGRDVAAAGFDYALGAGVSVELMTTGWIGGTATLALTGNELGNEIWGNDGVNALNGGGGNDALLGFGGNDRLDGGTGFDLLIGGTGQDSFAFATALVGADADLIADFSSVDDTILLDDAVFAGLSLGALNPGAFVIGTAALDANDRIIYDAAAGRLYFDADGSGTGAAVLFATVGAGTAITAADFQVI